MTTSEICSLIYTVINAAEVELQDENADRQIIAEDMISGLYRLAHHVDDE